MLSVVVFCWEWIFRTEHTWWWAWSSHYELLLYGVFIVGKQYSIAPIIERNTTHNMWQRPAIVLHIFVHFYLPTCVGFLSYCKPLNLQIWSLNLRLPTPTELSLSSIAIKHTIHSLDQFINAHSIGINIREVASSKYHQRYTFSHILVHINCKGSLTLWCSPIIANTTRYSFLYTFNVASYY